MTLLLDEIRSAIAGREDKDIEEDVSMMQQQLTLCSRHLQQLTQSAIEARDAKPEKLTVSAWLKRLRESATLLWPAGPIRWPNDCPEAKVEVDAILDQAVLNLLANALAASPQWVAVTCRNAGNDRVEIIVEDQGDGLEGAVAGAPGEDVVDSRNGLGVGLFLSNATIQRLGGHLRARVNDQGTTMVIDLPVSSEPSTGVI